MTSVPTKRILSHCRKHEARLSPSEGSLWDSSHANLSLHDLPFGSRLFGWHGVWSPCSRYFAVSEWRSAEHGPDMLLLVIDIAEKRECVIARAAGGFVEPMGIGDGAVKYSIITSGMFERSMRYRLLDELTGWRPVGAEAPENPDGQTFQGKFPVFCPCGMAYDYTAWLTLKYDGIQSGYDELKGRQVFDDLEMRRCACGSSMAIPVGFLRSAGLQES